MPGERDLGVLLATLDPLLDAREFAYATLPPGTGLPAGLDPMATVREAEGLTVIAPAEACRAHGVDALAGWAMITLRVHSSLEAVGMMAAIAAALAERGISVNAVAGYHHDHIFVQWDRREDAMRALAALATAR